MRRKRRPQPEAIYHPDPASLGMHNAPIATLRKGGMIGCYRKGGRIPKYSLGGDIWNTVKDAHLFAADTALSQWAPNAIKQTDYDDSKFGKTLGTVETYNEAYSSQSPQAKVIAKAAPSLFGPENGGYTRQQRGEYMNSLPYAQAGSSVGEAFAAKGLGSTGNTALKTAAPMIQQPAYNPSVETATLDNNNMPKETGENKVNTYNGPYQSGQYRNGGRVNRVPIDIENGELMINPANHAVVSDYQQASRHRVGGDPDQNFVMGIEGHVIIPRRLRGKYLTGDKRTRQAIINSLPSNSEGKLVRGVKGISDPDRGKPLYVDPYTGYTIFEKDEDIIRADQERRAAERVDYGTTMDEQGNLSSYNPGIQNVAQASSPNRSSNYAGYAESAIPYVGDTLQMANALFSKPQYGRRLRNKEYGTAVNLMANRRYDNRDEIRDINAGFNSAKYAARDASGGSSGTVLASLNSLSNARAEQVSKSYANKSNIDNQYKGQEAEARIRLGSEDAQYQGLYDQDKLMAQAARRKNIYAPMQNMGKTYLEAQALANAYGDDYGNYTFRRSRYGY